MKQKDYINAYKVIQKYQDKELSLDVSYGLFKVKKLLQPQWDFQLERETAIFTKYSPEQDEEGNLKFKDEESKTKFAEELAELLNMDVESKFEKVKINFNGELKMSMGEIETLDNFIEF